MRLAALAAASTCLGVSCTAVSQDMNAAPPGYVKGAWGDPVVIFVHADSIRRNGAFIESWELQNYAEPRYAVGTPYLSLVTLTRHDCARRRSGEVVASLHPLRGANGGAVYSSPTNNDPEMTPHPPGTTGEAVLEFVCARG